MQRTIILLTGTPDAEKTTLHELLTAENTPEHGWFVIDNSQLTVHETVEVIRKHI